MKFLALGALALTLAACTGGIPGVNAAQCEQAQQAMAVAKASIAAWPDQTAIPNDLLAALVIAEAQMPVFCAAP